MISLPPWGKERCYLRHLGGVSRQRAAGIAWDFSFVMLELPRRLPQEPPQSPEQLGKQRNKQQRHLHFIAPRALEVQGLIERFTNWKRHISKPACSV